MREREELAYREMRERVYERYDRTCVNCGAHLNFDTFHMAHKIPQRDVFIRQYGKKIIHDEDNFEPTCPTDSCNNSVSLGNKPVARERLAERIREKQRGALYGAR